MTLCIPSCSQIKLLPQSFRGAQDEGKRRQKDYSPGWEDTCVGFSSYVTESQLKLRVRPEHAGASFHDSVPSCFQDRIDGITIQARQFQDAGHFDAENIKKKQEALVARYEALKEPMIARKQKLADSLRLQQLFRDVEDEETWIREKEPIAASTNRGQSVSLR